MSKLVLVSADGHNAAPPEAFRPYLEERFHPDLDDLAAENAEYVAMAVPVQRGDRSPEAMALIDGRGALAAGADDASASDMSRRLKELDAEGVVAEILLPAHSTATTPFFGTINRPHRAELRAAGARAYHRWLADQIKDADGRLHGVAEAGPCLDMDETTRELKWVAEHGFPATMLPGFTADSTLPPLYDAHYEPFWATCADAGLVLVIHAGWGAPQGQIQKFLDFVAKNMGGKILAGGGEALPEEVRAALVDSMNNSDESPLILQLGPRRVLWQLMLGGVFDRYPDLKLVLTEIRADWLPATLDLLDAQAAKLDTPLTMRPSEYVARNCVMAPSSPHRAEIELRNEIGVDRLLFGMDFPHHEGTWPNTWDWIRDSFRGVSESDARRILGENAIDVYGLDRAKLTALAEKIGPDPADLLGDFHVDPQLIDHFHNRAGYLRPVEEIDVASITTAFSADLAAVGVHA
jgi:predicted TIM-barrel fold metal-dependent hydrolase